MFKTKYSVLFASLFLAAIFFIWACREDYQLPYPQKTEQDKEQQTPSYITAIKRLINNESLSLPVMYNVKVPASTRLVSVPSQLDYTPENVDILWDSLKIFHEGKRDIYWIPMIPANPVVGYVYIRSGGKQSARANTAVFHLLAWKKGEQMAAKVITYIPDNTFLKNGGALHALTYNVKGTRFSGVRLESALDGTLLKGSRYQHGKSRFMFKLRSMVSDSLRNAKTDSLNNLYKIHISLSCQMKTTRHYDENGEFFEFKCSICGGDATKCDCIKVVNCGECGNPEDQCICCSWCGSYPCRCCYICGNYPCICPETCPKCGRENCDGTCDDDDDNNEGGGGGGGSNPDNPDNPSNIAPKAKKIFRNSNMIEENWRVIENMLEKIMEDCMGNTLYNGLVEKLNGKTLTIQFNLGQAGSFGQQGESVGISLGKQESNQLFHEMVHAYQAYNETPTTFVQSRLNREIEAHYAQYLYVRKLPEYEGSKWEEKYATSPRYESAANLKDYIDEKGILKVSESKYDLYLLNTVIPTFRGNGYPAKNYEFDYYREHTENFKNLYEISKDC